MKRLAHALLRLRGWSFTGELPPRRKLIVVGAPHTSNWDFLVFLAALHHHRIKPRFIAKHTLFRWPLAGFFEALGGIPVDRERPTGIVKQVVETFQAADDIVLVIAPEGTRKAVPHWKSGFLEIARETGAPVVLASVDGATKEVAIGPAITVGEDVEVFLAEARLFYRGKRGFRPDRVGPVAVRERS